MNDDNLPPLPEPMFCSWHSKDARTLINPTGVVNAFPWPPRSPEYKYWADNGYHSEPLYTAAQVEEIRRAAVLAERDRFRAMFDEALADHSITWPGEVDILYEKMFPAAAIREGVK